MDYYIQKNRWEIKDIQRFNIFFLYFNFISYSSIKYVGNTRELQKD